MVSKKTKRVTKRFVKRQFTTVGLVLILYLIMAIIFPRLYYYLCTSNQFLNIVNTPMLVVGGIYTLVFIGTIVPFLFIKKAFKIKQKDYFRSCKFSFGEFIVHLVVFLALGSALMFMNAILSSYLPLGEGLLLGIIMDLPSEYVLSPIYGILFCLAIPILEEVCFRGILLRALGRYGNRFAIYTTAFIYALMQQSLSAIIPSFILALFLNNMTLRYRSITPAIFIHIFFNSFLFGIEFIPADFALIVTGIFFALYLLALYFVIVRAYVYAKVNKSSSNASVAAIFYSRFSVILAIVLSITYTVLTNLF